MYTTNGHYVEQFARCFLSPGRGSQPRVAEGSNLITSKSNHFPHCDCCCWNQAASHSCLQSGPRPTSPGLSARCMQPESQKGTQHLNTRFFHPYKWGLSSNVMMESTKSILARTKVHCRHRRTSYYFNDRCTWCRSKSTFFWSGDLNEYGTCFKVVVLQCLL